MWRKLRVIVLLFILATVIQQTWLEKQHLNWDNDLYVAIYPINADGSAKVSDYLRSLNNDDLVALEDYFSEEAAQYKLAIRQPIKVRLGSVVSDIPSAPPSNGEVLPTIVWSLKFRWFAWRHSPSMMVKPNIRLYALFYDPVLHPVLSHSTALNKGRIGRVNVFGDAQYAKQNLIILAHELLHTLGATDKYDLNTTLPIYPDGYAEPNKIPRYPQQFAELMAGRTPVSEMQAEIPKNLKFTIIGNKTAQEIGWRKQ